VLDSHRFGRGPALVVAFAACAALAIVAYLLLAAPPSSQGSSAAPAHAVAGHGKDRARVRRWTRYAATHPATQVGPGHLSRIFFHSQALHRVADYLVYLPRDYRPTHRLPVFYGLHGMPGRPLAFTANADIELRLERLIAAGRVSPMILVFPDGRIDGRTSSDSEWANTRSGAFLSYVVDVVHDVDLRFATLPFRQDRVIAGLSAGAYGAVNLGLHAPALFGAVQVWSGYFLQTPTGVFSHATPQQIFDNSPLEYVFTRRVQLRRDPLRAFFYVGRDESDSWQTPPMVAALRATGSDVDWAIYPGGHNWNLWSGRLNQMLLLAARDFAAGPAPAPE